MKPFARKTLLAVNTHYFLTMPQMIETIESMRKAAKRQQAYVRKLLAEIKALKALPPSRRRSP